MGECCAVCVPPTVQPTCRTGGAPLANINCPTQRCPAGYTCETDPLDRWAVCCRDCRGIECSRPLCPASQQFTPAGECCPDCRPEPCTPIECIPPVNCSYNDPLFGNGCKVGCGRLTCSCGANMEFSECASGCPRACQRREPGVCALLCRPGCVCKKGFILNAYGECIPEAQCPVCTFIVDCFPPTHCQFINPEFDSNGCQTTCGTLNCSCTEKEELLECGTSCPPTCEEPNPQMCTLQCVRGCFCKDGLIRTADGDCIPPDQCLSGGRPCPVPDCAAPPPGCVYNFANATKDENGCTINCGPLVCNPDHPCGEGEQWLECGSACPPTCNDPTPDVCTEQCVQGCFCGANLLRRSDGRCVSRDQCDQPCPVVDCAPPPANCRYVNPTFNEQGCQTTCGQLQCGAPNPGSCDSAGQRCGGFAGISCPTGSTCMDDPSDDCDPKRGGADCGGICQCAAACEGEGQTCGGITGLTCAQGLNCVDDPSDNCNPNRGGRDCIGICQCNPNPPSCEGQGQVCGGIAGFPCPQGSTCEDDPRDNCDPRRGGADCSGICQCSNAPCPVVDCAAPPENCRYVDPVFNEQGCQLNCGRLQCGTPPPGGCEGAGQQCGGLASLPCPTGSTCVDDPSDNCVPGIGADCGGICQCVGGPIPHGCRGDGQMCGGVASLRCFQGSTCVDDPNDNCNPAIDGIDCAGSCQCNVDCPIMDCFPTPNCQWVDPTWDATGCQSGCGTLSCTCTEDEELLECGSACAPTCENPAPVCAEHCVRGCFCKNGTLRAPDGQCVTRAQCPATNPCAIVDCPPLPVNCTYVNATFDDRGCKATCGTLLCASDCRADQEWSQCGRLCQRRCDSPDPMVCPRICLPGCVCKPGLVLLDDGRCVTPDQCPDDGIPHGCRGDGQTCGGLAAIQCPQGSRCVDNPNDRCDPATGGRDCAGVCQCNVECPIMDCFPANNCQWADPTYDENGCQSGCGTLTCTCDANEDLLECGSNCPLTCQHPYPQVCDKRCVYGCFCKEGLLRTADGRCVTREHCVDTTPCASVDCAPLPENCTYVNATFDDRGCQLTCGTMSCGSNCRADQEWSQCGRLCQRRCDSPDPMICPTICAPGCVCKAGLVLLDDGRCVTPDQCPSGGSNCRADQEWSPCGRLCQRRCDSPDPMICPTICAPGCVCKAGLVLLDDGRCVTPDQCPSGEIPHGCRGDGQMCGGIGAIQCPQGSRCVDDPNDSCNPATGGRDCAGVCQCNVSCPIMDCFPTHNCEWVNPTWDENGCQSSCGTFRCTCDANEDLRDCGSDCPPTCQNPNPICDNHCVPGCFCKAGLFRTVDGRCVTWNQCTAASSPCAPVDCSPPPENCTYVNATFDDRGCKLTCGTLSCASDCRPDQEWSQCGLLCQRRCDSPDPMICPTICAPGCVCKAGLVLLDDGRCVTPDQCPRVHVCTQLCVIGTQCNPSTGSCEAVSCDAPNPCPANKQCRSANKTCTSGAFCPQFDCVDATSTCEGGQRCGGISGTACPSGSFCADDTSDNCDPRRGGVDCAGICRCCVTCNSPNACPNNKICQPVHKTCGMDVSTCEQFNCVEPRCRGEGQTCGRRNDGRCPTGTRCVDDTTDTCVPSSTNFCPGTCRCL